MNAQSKKFRRMNEIKAESKSKLENIESLRKDAIAEIDKICAQFTDQCNLEFELLNELSSLEDVRERALQLDQKTSRLSNFFKDIPVLVQEQIEKARESFSSANSVVDNSWDDFLKSLETTTSPTNPSVGPETEEIYSPSEFQFSCRKSYPDISASKDAEQHSSGSLSDYREHMVGTSEHYVVKPIQNGPSVIGFESKCTVDATITHIMGPHKFYVQLQSLVHQLEALQFSLNEFMTVEVNRTVLDTKTVPCIAVALSTKWNSYFRVYVRRVLEDCRLEVFYIDYGDVEDVQNNKCFELASYFSKVPAAAIACALQPSEDGDLVASRDNHTEYLWSNKDCSLFKRDFNLQNISLNILGCLKPNGLSEYERNMYSASVTHENLDVFTNLVKVKGCKPRIHPKSV